MNKIIPWAAAIGIFASFFIGLWFMLRAFLDSTVEPWAQENWRWAAIYAVLFLIIGLTYRIWNGRLLLIIESIAVCALLLLPAVLAGLAFPLFIFAAWLFIAVVSGDWLIQAFYQSRSENPPLTLFERFCLGIAIGLGGFMLLSLLMAILGAYTRSAAYIVLLAFTLVSLLRLRPSLKWATLRQRLSGFTTLFSSPPDSLSKNVLLFGILLIILVGSYFWALAPSVRFDALMYQLAAPERYIEAGRMLPIPESMNTTYAHYANLLFGFGLLLYGQPLPGLLHFLMGLLLAGFTYILGTRLFNPRIGQLAAVLLLSLPWLSIEIGTAYIDAFTGVYLGAMFFTGLLWWRASGPLWLSGIFAGLALGVKLTALPSIIIFALLLGLAVLWKNQLKPVAVPQVLRVGAQLGLPAMLLFSPWMLRDWLWSGTPFYPWHADWLAQRPDLYLSTMANNVEVSPLLWHRLLRYPWMLLANPVTYHESPGGANAALPFLGLPWFFAFYPAFSTPHRQRGFFIFFQFLLTSAICLALFGPRVRYNLPSFIFLALGAALNLDSLAMLWKNPGLQEPILPPALAPPISQTTSSPRHLPLWATGLGIACLLFYLFVTRLATILPLMVHNERYPLSFLSGRQSADEFLTSSLPIYPIFLYLNTAPDGPHKVLSIGNEFRLYTTAHIYASEDGSYSYSLLHHAISDEQLAEDLHQHAFDFLLIDEHEVAARPSLYQDLVPTPTFLTTYARLVYFLPGIRLYQLSPQPVQRPPIVNLLSNPDFEELPPDNLPPAWSSFGVIALESSSDRVYNGALSLRLHGETPAEAYGFINQIVPITGGGVYTLGYWAYPDVTGTLTLQIIWLDENSIRIGQDAQWPIADLGWNWYSMTVAAPSAARYAQVVIACNGAVDVWFDQTCFVEGEWCSLP